MFPKRCQIGIALPWLAVGAHIRRNRLAAHQPIHDAKPHGVRCERGLGAIRKAMSESELPVFVAVKRADGSLAYTRDGNFQTDSTGSIVTNDGDKLDPPITIPPGSSAVNVSADGTVSGILVGTNS